ncbi:Copine-6 [Seminavis robusta]|uniref:Copine-6 n=1 Tax=Seminavis robusta TaxID=568900 RepID=A0A9N8HBX3_9STRA|nr:Copine-6 [Seminavis robusta]|eukprot:Sro382_g131120.1 Copine-6 (556) ;mRNA; r:48045-50232
MKLEVSIHASKLKNVAGAFKGTSDPFAVVTKLSTTPGEKPVVLGKTEVINDSLSPDWVKVFTLEYSMGTPCKIAINLFDEVQEGKNLSMGQKLKKGGTIYVAIRKSQSSGTFRFKFKGTKLKNVEGFFGTSDPFFEIARKVESSGSQRWDNVFRSEDIRNNLNPEWKEATMDLSALCGGDLDLPLEISVFDHEKSGKHDPMGRFETSVNGLINASKSNSSLTLTNKHKHSGTIEILTADVSGIQQITQGMQQMTFSPPPPTPASRATFVDYVSGGCELNVVVAIDFTGSNGDPRKPGALHHIDANSRNQYEQAMAALVSILLKYDSDQMIPVVGFGAKYGGVVRHCFQCGPTPEAHGLNGVMEGYNAVFRSGLIMSGPTVFTEVMEMAASRAQSAQQAAAAKGKQAYMVLLILTDGAVSDVNATAACLSRINDNPLSIVIVGVGNADFGAMQFLDDVNAGANGRRDIAQFVAFNQHAHSSHSLTNATLAEIPQQLQGYFQSKGIAPLPPVMRQDEEIVVGEAEDEIDLSLDIGAGEEEIVITSGGDDFVNGFNAS